MNKKLYQDRDWLYQKYCIEKLTTEEVGKICGTRAYTIFRWLKRLKVPTRTIAEARKLYYKKHPGVRRGKNNPAWKGGITKIRGYIFVLKPEHPAANSNGYIKRARLVAEKILGRYLYLNEITHHKNGIRNDDRPENIEISTQSKHMSLHNKNRGKDKEIST